MRLPRWYTTRRAAGLRDIAAVHYQLVRSEPDVGHLGYANDCERAAQRMDPNEPGWVAYWEDLKVSA